MTEWRFAQRDPAEQLARLHQFAMKKAGAAGEVEFLITVREYITPKDPSMPFFAVADKEVNQRAAPYTPCGWGATLLEALSACMEGVRRFPYEPEARQATAG
jgi:hypothetical protein